MCVCEQDHASIVNKETTHTHTHHRALYGPSPPLSLSLSSIAGHIFGYFLISFSLSLSLYRPTKNKPSAWPVASSLFTHTHTHNTLSLYLFISLSCSIQHTKITIKIKKNKILCRCHMIGDWKRQIEDERGGAVAEKNRREALAPLRQQIKQKTKS